MENARIATVYLGIGSNQGDSEKLIRQSLLALDRIPGIKVDQTASLYRTAPWGNTQQKWFLNTVTRIKTTLQPKELLTHLQALENQMGRVRQITWGPRTIDLDILLYNEELLDYPDLIVPHPHMLERAFVMVPLAELAPELTIQGETVAHIAKILKNSQEVVGTGQKVW